MLTKRPIQKPSRSVITIIITVLVVSITIFHFLVPSTPSTYGPVTPPPPPQHLCLQVGTSLTYYSPPPAGKHTRITPSSPTRHTRKKWAQCSTSASCTTRESIKCTDHGVQMEVSVIVPVTMDLSGIRISGEVLVWTGHMIGNRLLIVLLCLNGRRGST